MNDLISRQAAIDEFEKELSAKYNRREFAIGFVGIKSILQNLSSPQPEIIRCKECKWKQGAECTRFADVRPFPDDYCSKAERRTDEQTD